MARTIRVDLTEAELRAVDQVVGPFVTRYPRDTTLASAWVKFDTALLAHEENAQVIDGPSTGAQC